MGTITKYRAKDAPFIRTLMIAYFERFLVYIRNITFVSCKKSLKNPFG
jgi:hypothetical protein